MFLTVIETKCIEENEIHVSTEMFLQTNTFFSLTIYEIKIKVGSQSLV